LNCSSSSSLIILISPHSLPDISFRFGAFGLIYSISTRLYEEFFDASFVSARFDEVSFDISHESSFDYISIVFFLGGVLISFFTDENHSTYPNLIILSNSYSIFANF